MKTRLNLAFALYKYFPFGGLQRDFLHIATACYEKNCRIRVYTFDWQGHCPDWIDLHLIPKKGWTSQAKNEHFTRWITRHKTQHPVDALIGFNKMPGLDIYYAADGCYEARIDDIRGRLYRLGGRYRHFSHYERAVFDPNTETQILMISQRQQPIYQSYHRTPAHRFHMLPPGITRDRIAPPDSLPIRKDFRKEFSITKDQQLLLMAGSGFKTKGVDRTLAALAALPQELREKTRLFVIGQDNPASIIKQAGKLGVKEQFQIFSGRDDISRFMLGADILMHPARHENTGTVLLEAIISGLPVITTDVCGYAHYVADANMGIVLESPFQQSVLNQALQQILSVDNEQQKDRWRKRGKRFSQVVDIYSMPEAASRIIIAIAEESRGGNLSP